MDVVKWNDCVYFVNVFVYYFVMIGCFGENWGFVFGYVFNFWGVEGF